MGRGFEVVLFFVCFCYLLMLSLILYITFLIAYINNGEVLITINTYNEGLLEFLVLPMGLSVCVYSLYRYVKKHFKIKKPKTITIGLKEV